MLNTFDQLAPEERSKVWSQLHNGSASARDEANSRPTSVATFNPMNPGGAGLINPSSHLSNASEMQFGKPSNALMDEYNRNQALDIIAENNAPDESRPSDPMNDSRPTVLENRPVDDNDALRVSEAQSSLKQGEIKDEW
jgi:hypothetical protein